MKVEPSQVHRLRVHADAKLWQLPEPGLGMLKLLMVGFSDPNFDPVLHDEWRAWVDSGSAMWGSLFTRTQVRQLPQDQRAWSELGLTSGVRVRPARDQPLQDTGPLARAVGIEWEAGLDAMLACLAHAPDTISRPLVAGALVHAVDCAADTCLMRLVTFAHDAGWAGQDIGIPGALVARAWRVLVGEDGPDQDVDVLLDQLLAISALRPDTGEEVQFWNALQAPGESRAACHAMEAWVKRYPAAWDRLHDKALVSSDVVSGWLMACEQALSCGVDTPLFRAALGSAGAPEWLIRLGWGQDREGSPLASWWARWVDIEHARLRNEDDITLGMPGQDPVSHALRAAGTPEPGSARDRALGGKCFAALLPVNHVQVEWFRAHPSWVYEHPRGGSNPLFHSRTHGEFEKWRSVGFDPRRVNRKGDTAAARFIANATRNPRRLAAQLQKAFMAHAMPATGMNEGKPLVHALGRLGDGVLQAWLAARVRDPAPLLPTETGSVARLASGHVVQDLVAACRHAGQWNDEHAQALWSGMAYRDTAEDADAWQALIEAVPLVETPDTPLWISVLDPDEPPATVARAMEFLARHGAAPPSVERACWQAQDMQAFVADAIVDLPASSVRALIPPDADEAWWVAQMQAWLGAHASRSASHMSRWVLAGLPLVPSVVSWLHGLEKPAGAGRSPWWEEPVVASALQAMEMDLSVPSPTRSRVRRF